MQKRNGNGRIIRKPKPIITGGQIIPNCEGCKNQIVGLCNIYEFPEAKWGLANCNMATHITTRIKEEKAKKRVGQQKQKIMK